MTGGFACLTKRKRRQGGYQKTECCLTFDLFRAKQLRNSMNIRDRFSAPPECKLRAGNWRIAMTESKGES